jgi:hypothetical protein
MEECEYLETCLFYVGKMKERPEDTGWLREEYCHKSPLRCARHMIAEAIGEADIPDNLYPDEKMKAYELIAESS